MTSSYRNRTSPLEGGYDREAKDLEAHRKSWIADATGAVKDWKSSASATAKLQDYVDQAELQQFKQTKKYIDCLLYTSPSPRDRTRSRMPSSA